MQKICGVDEVSIELTHRCNMYCDFCFNQYSKDFEKNFIDFEKLKRILVSFRKQGLLNVRFTGGEPLLHPQIFPILAFSKKLGFFITLNTNGILLNAKTLPVLEKYVDSLLLSFHFPINENSFIISQKIKALYLVSKSKIPFKKISTRLNSYFVENVFNICYFFDRFCFDDVICWFPLKSKKEEQFIISQKQYASLVEKLLVFKKIFRTRFILGFPPAYCFSGCPQKIQKLAESEDYTRKLVITPNLTTSVIYYYFPDEGVFPSGEIDFKKISESKFLTKYRSFDWLSDKCKSCSFLDSCLGGNRINAWMTSGDFFGKDPRMV